MARSTNKKTHRPFDIEALWQIERVGAPSLAPDGAQAVATVTSYSMEDNKSSSSLWLLSTLGGAPRRLTACGDKDGAPRWSPRGDRIAFTARREQQGRKDDEAQLYLIAPDGGEAVRAADIATGVEAFRWSPRGDALAFVSWVWPDERGTQAQAKRMKAWRERKETAYATSEAQYRHWDHHLPQERVPHLHWLVPGDDPAATQGAEVRDLLEGTGYEISRADPDADQFDISPDGRRIVFAFDPTPEKRSDGRFALAEIELAPARAGKAPKVGAITVIAQDAGWSFGAPRYSPDGERIAFLASHQAIKHTMPQQLAVWQRPGTAARTRGRWEVVSAEWDHEVEAPLAWEDDGSALVFAAQQKGRRHLWRFDLADRRAEVVAAGGWVNAFDKAAGTLVTLADSATHPPRLEVQLPGAGARRIESFNDERLARFAFGRVEERWIRGADAAATAAASAVANAVTNAADAATAPTNDGARGAGPATRRAAASSAQAAKRQAQRVAKAALAAAAAPGDEVQLWLVYPPGFDAKKKYPLLHLIHGGPHTAFGDAWHFRWNAQVFANAGCVVAMVNYHGSSGYGYAFLDSITQRWGELELIDVEAATTALLAEPWVDAKRVFASGGSYGGFMVAWMNGHVAPGRYAAYVCHAGCFDWIGMFADDAWAWHAKELGAWYWDDMAQPLRQSPHAFVRHMGTPTLVIHGALDYRVPDAQGLAYYNTLKARGVPARLVWFPDENHWVLKPRNSRLWYGEFLAWLEKHDAGRGKRKGRLR